MTIAVEQRPSDSPYVATVMLGQTVEAGCTIRPAEICWHMVFVREHGKLHPLLVGPWSAAGIASWGEGAEILWVKFRPGVFMPHLPVDHLLDCETALPQGAGQSFWLNSSTWELPSFENVETFIERLVRDEVLVCDPIVGAVLDEQPHDYAPRTVRHHFRRATGLSPKQIQQMRRAQLPLFSGLTTRRKRP